ncbi:hypothetical protein NHP190012_09930 [Helicobacter sp. NHP19-012]|uniref:Uncharacterized protein n=1 Tax=Helicobacter gastrofelis TaxID=2849642 RepID=A0ABM7SHE3_9HELI|nr:hypothetical protein NHP190012_09930 [Helicobacter sp. NHP19-012]
MQTEQEQQILENLKDFAQQKKESQAHYNRLLAELQRLQASNIGQERQTLQENFNRFVNQGTKDLESLAQKITRISNTQDNAIKPLDFLYPMRICKNPILGLMPTLENYKTNSFY